jgi:hypothetical protein
VLEERVKLHIVVVAVVRRPDRRCSRRGNYVDVRVAHEQAMLGVSLQLLDRFANLSNNRALLRRRGLELLGIIAALEEFGVGRLETKGEGAGLALRTASSVLEAHTEFEVVAPGCHVELSHLEIGVEVESGEEGKVRATVEKM